MATGYNGQLPGQIHCGDNEDCAVCDSPTCNLDGFCRYDFTSCTKDERQDRRYCRAVHAEANAILQAAKMGISLEGASLYCTLKPCPDCIKMIASAGIEIVYYEMDYYHDDPDLWRFWEAESGLEFVELKVSEEALALAREALGPETSRREV